VRAGRLITDVPSIEASCIAVCRLSHHQRAHSSAGAFRSDLEGEGCDIPPFRSERELSPVALTSSQVRPMGAARARHDRWGSRISANEMEVSSHTAGQDRRGARSIFHLYILLYHMPIGTGYFPEKL
jgi:hypothetical protein